jgi:hypothetical protein
MAARRLVEEEVSRGDLRRHSAGAFRGVGRSGTACLVVMYRRAPEATVEQVVCGSASVGDGVAIEDRRKGVHWRRTSPGGSMLDG